MSMRGVKKPGHPDRHLLGPGPVPLRRRPPGPRPCSSSTAAERAARRPVAGPARLVYAGVARAACRTGSSDRPLVMGILNVTPDSFSDGGRYFDAGRRRGPRPRDGRRGGRPGRRGRRVHPPRAPSRSPSDEELRRVRPGDRGPGRRGAGLGRHHEAGGGRGRRGRRGHAWSTTSRARCGRWRPTTGSAGWPCTCRARRPTCRTTPATTTWWPRCDGSSGAGRPGRRRRGRRGLGRPGHRLRQDGRAQPGPAGPPRRAGGGGRREGSGVLVGTSRKRFLGALRRRRRRRRRPVEDRLRLAGHRHLGHGPGGGDGAGPRRGRRPSRRPPWSGRPGPGPRAAESTAAVKGQVGGGHPAPQLHLGHPGPPGGERAARGASPPTTAGSAARRRSSGCGSRGSTGSSRCSPRPHNLHAYEDEGLAWAHYPLPPSADPRPILAECYEDIERSLAAGRGSWCTRTSWATG